MFTAEHKQRVDKELRAVGVTKHAMRKNEVSYLPHVIHEQEKIGAAINGRSQLGSVMLVATDRRVIFLDCKAFYTTTDEITYDVVSGVVLHVQGLFANVILHTRIGDYNLRFVNVKQAQNFVEFIETKTVESQGAKVQVEKPTKNTQKRPSIDKLFAVDSVKLDKKAKLFLETHNLGILSTVDRAGVTHGAAVYYVMRSDAIYILTKSETAKARSMLYHPQVALTIVEELTYETLQITGMARVETDASIQREVFDSVSSLRNLEDQTSLPPVMNLVEGSFVVVAIAITEAKYKKFKN